MAAEEWAKEAFYTLCGSNQFHGFQQQAGTQMMAAASCWPAAAAADDYFIFVWLLSFD
jgi:hypothetical protein